jgi:S-adenosylmethionine-diacylglycerol 3-amino-3-carboxypropyl transferase
MVSPPFRSDLFYAVQNEDYHTERAVLQRISRLPPHRILMVASAGENVLSLLTHDTIASIDAVDLNLAQLHLCELRRTAIEHLTRDEQLRLFGSDPSTVGASGATDRLALFDRIHSYLPAPSLTFWDARRNRDIAFGVQHVGRNDVIMHDIQTSLHNAGFAPLQRPVQGHELDAWKAVYTDLMTAAYIRDLFGLPSEALAARIAGIAGYLGECHFRALQQPNADHNPFLTTVFANRYATAAGEAGLPRYLQQDGQTALRQRDVAESLRLHEGNIVELMPALAQTYGLFDVISISNIADWMTEEQFDQVALLARTCLTPGGAFLARTATGRSMIQQVMGNHLATDSAFNEALQEIERGPWFRTIAVGFHQE